MLDASKVLFDVWNNTGVLYCHWKSNEHLAEGLDGLTDLDVFVLKKHKQLAEQGLKEAKYIKFRPQKSAIYEDVDEWIGFDYNTGKLVHVHLHYRIITGTKFVKQYEFPLDEKIIETRILHHQEQVYVAAPEIEIIILYSRITLKANDCKNIKLKNDDIKEIVYLKGLLDLKALEKECDSIFGENGKKVFDLIQKEDLSKDDWFSVYTYVRKWLKKYMRRSDASALLRHKYFYFRNIYNAIAKKRLHKHPIGKKTLTPKGMTVCFIGADGSGKSTVSCEIEKWLTWKIEASRFYLGSGDHYNGLLKRFLRKVSSKFSHKNKVQSNSESKQTSEATPKTQKKESLIKKAAKRCYGLLTAINLKQIATRSYKEIRKAQKYVKKGAIALFDRFPQNQFEGLYDGPKIGSHIKKLGVFTFFLSKGEERAIRKAQKYQPDLMFKLCLPAEESVRRKPDHSIEEVRPKSEITENLVFEKSKESVIDATQPYEEEILQIKRIIWDELLNDNRI